MPKDDPASSTRLAGLELNALNAAGGFPPGLLDGCKVGAAATPVHDLNGEVLFHRIPLQKGKEQAAYADIAAHPALGGPLLAVSHGVAWDEKALLAEAKAAAEKQRRDLKHDEARFVAYSYPKVAVQFLLGGREALMVELWSWAPVPAAKPAARRERKPLEPGNFERWSLLEELPPERKRANEKERAKRLKMWDDPKFRKADVAVLDRAFFKKIDVKLKLFVARTLHYSSRNADHEVCYELRGQQTNVWCVGASTQMLLDFYRYEYTQVRLADELGLGTLANPNGLYYGNEQDVVDTVERLTSDALDADLIWNPTWALFKGEIDANRPVISFIPGHSRTVAGYIQYHIALAGATPYRGLLVYDPWPPNAGVITRWENFDPQNHRCAFTAQLTLV